jgi:MFS family permease
MTAEY